MPLVLPRRSLNLDFVRDGQASGDNYTDELSKLDALLTFARSSTATRFNAAGVLEPVAAGQPRFDFDPSTSLCKGLLIEEARTNLVTRSEEFNHGDWSKTNCISTANAANGPDGLATADKLVEDGSSGSHYFTRGVVTSAAPYVLSVYAKKGERSFLFMFHDTSNEGCIFDLDTGAAAQISGIDFPPAYGSVYVGNGWYRCWIKIDATAANNFFRFQLGSSVSVISYDGNGSSGIYLWGAQLEAGAFATSYIPTTTAAVTRAADLCYTTSLVPWFTRSGFTVLSEIDAAAQGPVVFDIGDGTGNNRLYRLKTVGLGVDTAGATVASIGATGLKAAGRYTENACAVSVDGGALVTDASCAFAASYTRLDLGSLLSTYVLNGHLRRFTYLPYAVSDGLLKAMSAN